MGPASRKRLFLSLAALGLAAAAGVGVNLRVERASGEETFSNPVYLIVHGPNDGEPLNNSVELSLEVGLNAPSYVVIYEGSRYVSSTRVAPEAGIAARQVAIPLDCTYLPNGKVNLSLYLFSERMDRLVGMASLPITVQNPLLLVPAPAGFSGSQVPAKVRGRPRDVEFQVEAARDPAELMRAPGDRSRNVETLQSGRFAPAEGMVVGAEGVAEDIVLNVDTLARAHTIDGAVMVWTRDSQGRWAHSMPVSIRSLPRPSPFLLRVPPAPRSQTTYRR